MTTITVTVSAKARLTLKTPPEAVGAELLLAAARGIRRLGMGLATDAANDRSVARLRRQISII